MAQQFRLKLGLSEYVAGIFTLASAIGGTDVIADLGAFAGTFDDISMDVTGPITVTLGTDTLAGQAQAGTLDCTVARVDDASYWNPNNPSSPLNSMTPGFVPARPAQLVELTGDGTEYSVFWGFLVTANWRLTTRSCDLHFEDLLWRLGRVKPTIASTGPTTTGAAIGAVLDAAGWTFADFRLLADGDDLDDFSADGTQTALDLIANLIGSERGTVYVRGDGVFVYEDRHMPYTRAASNWRPSTLSDLSDLQSGIDGDTILTRVTVTKTDPSGGAGTTWTSVDADAERAYGEGDAPSISSPYVVAEWGQLLADSIVADGVNGRPPITADASAVDDDTLTSILTSPLQTVFDIDDPVGGQAGEYIVQRIVHTIGDGPHRVTYTATKRNAAEFTLASAIGGADVLRY